MGPCILHAPMQETAHLEGGLAWEISSKVSRALGMARL